MKQSFLKGNWKNSFLVLSLFIFLIAPISAWNFDSSIGTGTVTVNTFTGNLTTLASLQDTNIPTPTGGFVLTFNSTNSQWEDQSAVAIGDTNCSVVGSCASVLYSESDPNIVGNLTNVNANILGNNSGGNDTFAGNYSSVLNTTSGQNTSQIDANILGNNSGGSDTFAGNYSSYINISRLLGYNYFNSTTWNNIWNETTNVTYATHANVNANGSGGSDTFAGNYSSYLNYSLTMINDVFWDFANKGFNLSFNTPNADALDIEGLGGFSGDLVHIHQHTGNPSNTRLLSLHAEDADVLPLDIIATSTVAINVSSGDLILNNGGVNATDWTNVSILEIQISDLAHITDTVGQNATFIGDNYTGNINTTNVLDYTTNSSYSTHANVNANTSSSDTWFGNYSFYINISRLLGYGYFNSTTWNNIWNETTNVTYATHANVNANDSGSTNATYSTHTDVNANKTFDTWFSNYSSYINLTRLFDYSYYNLTDFDFNDFATHTNVNANTSGSTNATYATHANVNANTTFDTWFGNYSFYINISRLLGYNYFNSTTWNNIWNETTNATYATHANVNANDSGSTNATYSTHTDVNANFSSINQDTFAGNYSININDSNFHVTNDSYLTSEVNWDANYSSNVTCLSTPGCLSNITWNGSHSIWT